MTTLCQKLNAKFGRECRSHTKGPFPPPHVLPPVVLSFCSPLESPDFRHRKRHYLKRYYFIYVYRHENFHCSGPRMCARSPIAHYVFATEESATIVVCCGRRFHARSGRFRVCTHTQREQDDCDDGFEIKFV